MNIFDSFINKVKLENYSKLAIVGSHAHSNLDQIRNFLHYIFDNTSIDTVICGNAPGVDQVTQEVADEHNLHLIVFEPENNEYKNFKSIPDIIQEAECVIAFNDHGSSGTKYAIEKAKELNKYFFEHQIII